MTITTERHAPRTTDEFFALVQAHGFSGIVPAAGDVLGDHWARSIGDLFGRTVEAEGLPDLDRKHRIWLVWQWLYCELAGMRSRVVATPPAIRAAGIELTDEDIAESLRLLLKSQDHI